MSSRLVNVLSCCISNVIFLTLCKAYKNAFGWEMCCSFIISYIFIYVLICFPMNSLYKRSAQRLSEQLLFPSVFTFISLQLCFGNSLSLLSFLIDQ